MDPSRNSSRAFQLEEEERERNRQRLQLLSLELAAALQHRPASDNLQFPTDLSRTSTLPMASSNSHNVASLEETLHHLGRSGSPAAPSSSETNLLRLIQEEMSSSAAASTRAAASNSSNTANNAAVASLISNLVNNSNPQMPFLYQQQQALAAVPATDRDAFGRRQQDNRQPTNIARLLDSIIRAQEERVALSAVAVATARPSLSSSQMAHRAATPASTTAMSSLALEALLDNQNQANNERNSTSEAIRRILMGSSSRSNSPSGRQTLLGVGDHHHSPTLRHQTSSSEQAFALAAGASLPSGGAGLEFSEQRQSRGLLVPNNLSSRQALISSLLQQRQQQQERQSSAVIASSAGGGGLEEEKVSASPVAVEPPARLPMPQAADAEKDDDDEEGEVSQKDFDPLGIDQDNNWISEAQCLLRSDFIEVTQASRKETSVGQDGASKSRMYQQVGIRCRYCAHLPSGERPSRSSAFPSSIGQLYQSFTMMQRDHFHKCVSIPLEKRRQLETLRSTNTQGACDSKQYWIYAAKKLGMFDTPRGIEMTPESVSAARLLPNFGTEELAPSTDAASTATASTAVAAAAEPEENRLLVQPSDVHRVHPFLFTVMSQLQIVTLRPSEQTRKRKTLLVGFSGLGCRYCCQKGRLGFSRTFPLRRRTLPVKLDDMVSHLQRCPLCPSSIKRQLKTLAKEKKSAYQNTEFFDRLWKQLGRDGDITA